MQEPFIIQAHNHYVIGTYFSRKHPVLITSGMDRRINFWSAPDWQLIQSIEAHQNSVNSLALNPNENLLASGSTDTTIRIWSFPQANLLHTLLDRKQTVAQVKFSPLGNLLGGVYYGGYAAFWNPEGNPIVRFRASKKNLGALDFHPNERQVALSGLGDEISIWALPEGELLQKFSAHPVAVSGLHFIQSGKVLVSMGYDQSIKFWDTQTWQLDQVLTFQEKTLRSLAFSSDDNLMAVGYQGGIQIWSLTSWNLLLEFPSGANALNQITFSPDQQWLAAGAADQKVRIWPLAKML